MGGGSRRIGLSRFASIVVGQPRMPALEQRPERAIERPRSGLQQTGAALLRKRRLARSATAAGAALPSASACSISMPDTSLITPASLMPALSSSLSV